MKLLHRGAYPPEWPLVSEWTKRAVGNRCIRCRHPNGDTRKKVVAGDVWTLVASHLIVLQPCDAECSHPSDGKMRVLTVHHLDGNKDNLAWWNLLALCQVCHLQIQAKLVPERPYLWEHTDWFKVYVAGFYAHQQGHDLSRAAIEADLPRYLAMGQPWLYAPEENRG